MGESGAATTLPIKRKQSVFIGCVVHEHFNGVVARIKTNRKIQQLIAG